MVKLFVWTWLALVWACYGAQLTSPQRPQPVKRPIAWQWAAIAAIAGLILAVRLQVVIARA